MIHKKISNIRNYINHPWKLECLFRDKIAWEKLCSSLDTIQDTQEAISFYTQLSEFDANSGGYLYVYGIMQALNLQQDAINNLGESLFNNKINWKQEYPTLYAIREQRNNSVGHPTKRGNNESFHMIARYSINKISFRMSSYYPKTGNKTNFEEVNVLDCIEIQENIVAKILDQTIKKLEEEYQLHKMKFKNKRISDLIPATFDYHVSKLFEHCFRDYPLAEEHFNIILETILNIEKEIEERYLSISALEGVEDELNIIKYILKRLQKTLIESKISDEMELRIFVQSLRRNCDELFDMIKEIDLEFSE